MERSDRGLRERELRQRRALAQEARGLLEHPIIVDAFRQIEELYTKKWATSEYENQIGREAAYYGLNALRDVRSKIASLVRDGRVVELELDSLEQERIKDLIDG